MHHGNGTQAIFWDDPRVLYVSTHQWPLYPGTGRAARQAGPARPGSPSTCPLPPRATGDVILQALDEVVAPVVERFAPTWVLASAGYDAHRADPMAGLELTSGDFADIAMRVKAFAPATGRLALLLEGGYDLDALRLSVGASLGRGARRGVPSRARVERRSRGRRRRRRPPRRNSTSPTDTSGPTRTRASDALQPARRRRPAGPTRRRHAARPHRFDGGTAATDSPGPATVPPTRLTRSENSAVT